MADKKISALTGAATPLAGTEVLPIVQSGSTVKVSVANLTDGRAVTATSLAATDFVNATNNVKAGSGTNETILQPKSILFYNTGAGDALINSADNTSTFTSIALNKTQVKLYTSNTERVNIGSTGDVTISTGNVVIGTPSKGIVDSTGTTSLQFTAFQVVSNKPILAPSVATAAGNTASTPTATPVTLFTPSGDGVWIVNALVTLTGAPAAYIASSMIKASGGVLAATAISTATNMSISVSGANVQATQTSGGDQIIAFSYIRLF